MGNSISVPFPSDQVISMVKNVVEVFTPIYVKAYSVELLRSERARAEEAAQVSASSKQFHLDAPPTQTEPLAQGWMVKLGGYKTNWKKRYFVAMNEQDNFEIHYYERQEDVGNETRRKGVIRPCGYSVRAVAGETEVRECGENAIILDGGDRRRKWMLRCDSADAQGRWVAVLRFAAGRAKPSLGDDPVVAAAFETACRRLRRQLGMWGHFRVDRDSQDELVELVNQQCEREIITPLQSRIPAGEDEAKVLAAVRQELNRISTNIVSAGWTAIQDRVEAVSTSLAPSIKANAPVALREVDERRRSLREATLRSVRLAATEVARDSLRPLLAAFLRPTYKAYKEAIKLFWERMNLIIDTGLKKKDLKVFFRDLRWEHGELLPVVRKLRALTRGEVGGADGEPSQASVLADLTVPLPDLVEMMEGYTLWEVEQVVETSLLRLVERAVYSVVQAVDDAQEGVTPVQCLHEVTRRMIQDAKACAYTDVRTVLVSIYAPAVRRRLAEVPAVRDALAVSVVTAIKPLKRADLDRAAAEASAAASHAGGASGDGDAAAGGGSGDDKLGQSTRKAERALLGAIPTLGAGVTQGFVDNDWLLDDIVEEAVDQTVSVGTDDVVRPMLEKLSKLPGKLGFI